MRDDEATVKGVPCRTFRDNTERSETITIGTNVLIDADPGRVDPAIRIVEVLERLLT